jgi:hypothetical protein
MTRLAGAGRFLGSTPVGSLRGLWLVALLPLGVACQPDQPAALTSEAPAAVTQAAAAAPPDAMPRTADGKPKLDGVWQALGTANWNLEPHAAYQGATGTLGAIGAVPPGLGVLQGGATIPYLPEARAVRDRNFANRRTEDPEAKCFRPGIPRATYLPYPFQIFQTDSEIFIAYQFANASRSIYMQDHAEAPIDSWMGWSNGRWDGDTLVVEVTGLNGQSWLDRAGNFASANARITERYTPEGRWHIRYEATIEDPTVFERPWTVGMMLYRDVDRSSLSLEFQCIEFAEELMYGHLSKAAAQPEGSSGND